mmetsp:Transcript_26697/g.40351  ORF Transcript_26697/g.40351 Transcript_26697/m.40351 type:complete len:142 (-) Transcript_26697:90-515(-)
MFISSKEVTPTLPKAPSTKTIQNNDNDKSPAQQLRSNIIDPVAMQLFLCRIEDHAQKQDLVDKQCKSETHIDTKSLPHDPMLPSSDNSFADIFPKIEIIRNLSGSLTDVKSVEDLSLLARPIPRKVTSQPKIETSEPLNHD